MKNNPPTAANQLTRIFIGLFIAILVVINLVFAATATGLVYHYADEQAEEVTETIADDWSTANDWAPLLNGYVARQDDDAIIITNGQGQHFQSPKAPKIFHHITHHQLALKNLRITHEGVYFLRHQSVHDGTVTVTINVDDLVRLSAWLSGLTIIIDLVAAIIAIPLIRRLAHRWTAPLTTLDADIDKLLPPTDHPQQVTVPQQPLEVSNVAESVNELLDRQFQAMQREKEFVANASHELKTPLAGIMGHVNLIKRHGKSHPELVDRSLQYIDKETQRMQGMVNDLLTLEGHQSPAPLVEVNLSPIINEEISSLAASYQQKFKQELPATCLLLINPSDFQRLAHNLLENAAKYSPASSTITVTLRQENTQVILTVADQGIGIAPENRQKIFDRFFREDQSHSSQVPGSGIGLAIVKAIVDKYAGTITVTANPPHGSLFTVSLPIQK